MVECGASEVSEDVMVEALEFGHKSLQPLIDLQEKMATEIGKPKAEVQLFTLDEDLKKRVSDLVAGDITSALEDPHDKAQFNQTIKDLEEKAVEEIAGEDETLVSPVKSAFDEALKDVVRSRIIKEGLRPGWARPG